LPARRRRHHAHDIVNKASHLLFGATAGALAAVELGAPLAAGAAVGAVAGLAPDVDHPGSTLGRQLPRAYHALTPGHRGPTHTVEWCALLGWGIAQLLPYAGASQAWAAVVGWAAFAGACSHLVADLLTEQGIPATMLLVLTRRLRLGPSFLRGGRVRLPRWLAIRTGGWAEPVVTAAAVALGLVTMGGWWPDLAAWVYGRIG
jgi:inner membrane protein